MENTPLWTVEDLAGYLNTTKNTIYRLTSRTKIPCFKIGKELRFDPNDVINYFKGQYQSKTIRKPKRFDARGALNGAPTQTIW